MAEEKKQDMVKVGLELKIKAMEDTIKGQEIMIEKLQDDLQKAGDTIGQERDRAKRFIDENNMIKTQLRPLAPMIQRWVKK